MHEFSSGEPVHGELHSTDASATVQIPIYKQGSTTAYTLLADEYICIHSFEEVSAAGGDMYIFIQPTNTPVAGSYVVRGTVAASGGIAMSKLPFEGVNSGLPWCTAPAGVVDVVFTGSVHKYTTGKRPIFREALAGH